MELLLGTWLVAHGHDLWRLTLLLLDLSLAHLDLLVVVGDGLHRRGISSHRGVIWGSAVSRRFLTILALTHEAFEFRRERLVTFEVSHEVQSHH